ncbi:hypothetical protein KDL45_14105, partial [bacterium]|nr:hypothetical protein [bacterium]
MRNYARSLPAILLALAIGFYAVPGCGDDDDDTANDADDDDSDEIDDDDATDDDIVDDDSVSDDDDDDDLKRPCLGRRAYWPDESTCVVRIGEGIVGYSGMSMAIDSDGTRHIATNRGGELILLSLADGDEPAEPWDEEFVSFHAVQPDLFIDPSDTMHLVFLDTWEDALIYGRRQADGKWVFEKIADVGEVEFPYHGGSDQLRFKTTRILIDATGDIHIAFLDYTGKYAFPHYAKRHDGAWTTNPVSLLVDGPVTDMAIGPNNEAYLFGSFAFALDPEDDRLAYWRQTDGESEYVSSEILGVRPHVLQSDDGKFVLAYEYLGDPGPGDDELRLASVSNDEWSSMSLTGISNFYEAVLIDDIGYSLVSYSKDDQADFALVESDLDGANVSVKNIFPYETRPDYPTLVGHPDGFPVLSYFADDGYRAMYAEPDGDRGWRNVTLDHRNDGASGYNPFPDLSNSRMVLLQRVNDGAYEIVSVMAGAISSKIYELPAEHLPLPDFPDRYWNWQVRDGYVLFAYRAADMRIYYALQRPDGTWTNKLTAPPFEVTDVSEVRLGAGGALHVFSYDSSGWGPDDSYYSVVKDDVWTTAPTNRFE